MIPWCSVCSRGEKVVDSHHGECLCQCEEKSAESESQSVQNWTPSSGVDRSHPTSEELQHTQETDNADAHTCLKLLHRSAYIDTTGVN